MSGTANTSAVTGRARNEVLFNLNNRVVTEVSTGLLLLFAKVSSSLEKMRLLHPKRFLIVIVVAMVLNGFTATTLMKGRYGRQANSPEDPSGRIDKPRPTAYNALFVDKPEQGTGEH